MRWFLIDMVEWKWVKSTNEIKAVLLFSKCADDITGVHKTHESNKDLRAAMHDLNVLVVHEAAHDSDVGVAVCGTDFWSLWHLSSDTARSMFTPPGVVGWDVKCQQIAVLGQASYVQVVTDDEDIPGHPQSSPYCVRYDVPRPILDGAKETQDNNDDVEEIGKDGGPLVAEEVKDLPLQCQKQL